MRYGRKDLEGGREQRVGGKGKMSGERAVGFAGVREVGVAPVFFHSAGGEGEAGRRCLPPPRSPPGCRVEGCAKSTDLVPRRGERASGRGRVQGRVGAGTRES